MDVCPTDIILAPAERIWRLVTDPRVLRADQLFVDPATRQRRWHASQATRGRNDGARSYLNVDCRSPQNQSRVVAQMDEILGARS